MTADERKVIAKYFRDRKELDAAGIIAMNLYEANERFPVVDFLKEVGWLQDRAEEAFDNIKLIVA